MNTEQEKRIQDIIEKSFLRPFLKDEGITDIRFNGTELRLQHNQNGRYRAEQQPTLKEVQRLAKQIADVQGKEINNSEPELNTEFGYMRINVMHDRVSPDGMTMAIRISRPRLAVTNIQDLTVNKRQDVEELLRILVMAGSNLVISGRTGSGKTELQKLLVSYIPEKDIIILIEDTRDSHIKTLYPKKDITSWQTVESDQMENNITIQDLVKAALRNNPDWVNVAETRGVEAADMLDAAKTDHNIITTLHAKGAMSIPSRFIPMIRQSPAYQGMSEQFIGREVTELFPFGIHLEMDEENGKIERRIKEMVEYTDFTKKGAVGTYLYREEKNYNGSYQTREVINPLSEKTLQYLKNKRLYHLLPSVFVENKEWKKFETFEPYLS